VKADVTPRFPSAGVDDIIDDFYSNRIRHICIVRRLLLEEAYHHHLSMRARIIRTCSSNLRTQRIKAAGLAIPAPALRTFQSAPPHGSGEAAASTDGQDDRRKGAEEAGAMSRRLAEMTEAIIDTGGTSTAKNVEAAGFSEELKKQLESRIAKGAFRSQNQRAFAEAELPVCSRPISPEFPSSFLQQIVLRRQRHSRSSHSSTMVRFRIPSRLCSTHAGRQS
jgi:hypothetical protein